MTSVFPQQIIRRILHDGFIVRHPTHAANTPFGVLAVSAFSGIVGGG
jgi:hypothetical protein